jgi:hypothetical protein
MALIRFRVQGDVISALDVQGAVMTVYVYIERRWDHSNGARVNLTRLDLQALLTAFFGTIISTSPVIPIPSDQFGNAGVKTQQRIPVEFGPFGPALACLPFPEVLQGPQGMMR